MEDLTRNSGISVFVLLGLIGVGQLPALMDNSAALGHLGAHSALVRYLAKVPAELHNGDLNAEDFDALTAGYYEGLRKDAGPVGLPEERDDVVFRDDFLRYELKPNVTRHYAAGTRITNSLGMANPEYGYEKPPHTRRIALLGDSVSLGPYGQDFGALLEQRLNQADLTPGVRKFELLNFAVYGYSVVQVMDVALEKAPKFHPDVYLVALTRLEFMSKAGWRTHVGRLVESGTGLKYPYLVDIAGKADVRPTDHLPIIRLKLAPYSRTVTRWALEQIRDRAYADGASMIVVLVPAPIDPEINARDMDVLHSAVDGMGVPIIDLRDTFASGNLEDLQVVPKSDIHPNVRGHEMIFENMYAKLRAQPEAWAALTGYSR